MVREISRDLFPMRDHLNHAWCDNNYSSLYAQSYTNSKQDVAKQMGQVGAAMGVQFTLSMGDNFYENGVKNVDDPHFSYRETFDMGIL